MFFFLRVVLVLLFAGWAYLFFSSGSAPDLKTATTQIKQMVPAPEQVGAAIRRQIKPEQDQPVPPPASPPVPENPGDQKPKIRIHN